MAILSESIPLNCMFFDIQAREKRGAILEILNRLVEVHALPQESVQKALRRLMDREELGSTGIGGGVAVPHSTLDVNCFAIARSRNDVEWNALDELPVHLIFLCMTPHENAGMHLEILAQISRLVKNELALKEMLKAPNPGALVDVIRCWENNEFQEPKKADVPEPQSSGCLLGWWI